MTDLSPTTRSLLDAAHVGMTPTVAETSRVRARLFAAVAVPTLVAAAATPASAAVPAAAAGTALVVKVGLVAGGVAAAVLATAIAVGTRGTPSPVPSPAPAATPAPASLPRPTVTPLPAPEPEPDAVVAPLPVPASKKRAPRADVDPTPPPDNTLARELGFLSTARAALRDGDPGTAVGALSDYRREFEDDGQLAAEASKLRAEALCALDPDTCVDKEDSDAP